MSFQKSWVSCLEATRLTTRPSAEAGRPGSVDAQKKFADAEPSRFRIFVACVALCAVAGLAGLYGVDWFGLFLEQFFRY